MLASKRAWGFLPRNDLRHINKCLNTCIAGGYSDVSGGFQKPFTLRWINEVDPLDAFHSGADRLEIQEIAGHDLGTEYLKLLRPFVYPMNEGAYRKALFDELFDDVGTCFACRSSYENGWFFPDNSPIKN